MEPSSSRVLLQGVPGSKSARKATAINVMCRGTPLSLNSLIINYDFVFITMRSSHGT
jgi:hypothetical protein